MFSETQNFPKKCYEQVVVADFADFQLVVPTTTKPVKKRVFSAWVTVPNRVYASYGWLIGDAPMEKLHQSNRQSNRRQSTSTDTSARQVVALLQGLHLGPIVDPIASSDVSSGASAVEPFPLAQRLSVSIPVSFQTVGSRPLPQQVSSQAAFTYQSPEDPFPYQAAFHQVVPRFTRIYPFQGYDAVLATVDQMLHDKALFLKQNYARLRHIPFYQNNFDFTPVDS